MTKQPVKIPIKVYEELDFYGLLIIASPFGDPNIEWVDNFGINTPYLVTWVNKDV